MEGRSRGGGRPRSRHGQAVAAGKHLRRGGPSRSVPGAGRQGSAPETRERTGRSGRFRRFLPCRAVFGIARAGAADSHALARGGGATALSHDGAAGCRQKAPRDTPRARGRAARATRPGVAAGGGAVGRQGGARQSVHAERRPRRGDPRHRARFRHRPRRDGSPRPGRCRAGPARLGVREGPPPRAMPGPDRQGTPEGLTSAEAAERMRRYGPNELAATRRFQAIRQIAGWLASPLIIILLLASAASAALGQVVSSIIIALMIVLGMALNFTQAYRSQVAAQRLRERVSQRATVVRDGTVREIPAVGVVPGDVVHLAAGDLVPADGTLATAKDLFLNEAALTGESLPAEKHASARVFRGTSVVSGRGLPPPPPPRPPPPV